MNAIRSYSLLILLFTTTLANAQCADPSTVYGFVYDGHSYDLVRENSTWTEASVCAVSRGGYLAEINDEDEQDAIFAELTTNAGITIANTENQFGTASVWIGGSDAGTEGEWIWDGDNDGNGPQFWSGGPTGNAVDGSYTNWGVSPAEPDNSGGQDHLTIIIKPTATNFGLWNDLVSTNSLYFLIEYSSIVSTMDVDPKSNFSVYPTPFSDFITLDGVDISQVSSVNVFSMFGQKLLSLNPRDLGGSLVDLSELPKGSYVLTVRLLSGELMSRVILK